MTEFFKNNPMALRNCIRFEILQGNPIEQAYSNICTILGEEAIDFKKFKIRFNHFSKKKYNDKEGENPCAKYLLDDKYALRVCILYESLKYQKDKSSVPVFEVFVNFCKVIGVEDVLKYTEFEFWFYRFLNGEFDLNYEKDNDKKIYELMDMPIDVMKNVVEYLDIFDRMKLAKTSRSLQTFVEDQKLFHDTLELRTSQFEATVSLSDSVNIEYIWDSVGCKKIFKDPNRRVLNSEYAQHNTGYGKRINTSETVVEGVTFWKQALLDFKGILKNPKLHLDTLKIELSVNDENALNDLKDELKFTHYLNVKNLILNERSWELLVKIVPLLKPGYLTSINISSHTPDVNSMKIVFEMEQWKQAKSVYMYGDLFLWSLHHLYHFKELHIRLLKLSVENFRQMKEFLFKSPNFEWCSVTVDTYHHTGVEVIEEEFGDYIQQGQNIPEYMKIYHYPIPISSEYFEIEVLKWDIDITRKKR